PDTSCRALVNLRVGGPTPGYRVVDVVFGRQIEGRVADGILVRDGKTDIALAASSGRTIALTGRSLKGGASVTWLNEGAGELIIEGVFGPFVSVRTRGHGAPSARYRMLRAPGEAADPVRLFGADLPMRFSARAAALHPTAALPEEAEHDPRNSALVVTHRGPRLVTIMGWGGTPLTVDVPLEPPPSLRAFTPRPDGRYLAPDACGTLQLIDGKLQAARGVDQLRPVEMDGVTPVALLGVHWIAVQDAFNIELFRAVADALR
ncbi:MAG: hypothetical protein KC620_02045, partial [Myxococcales bacterium]|nr:hypothetical protein [Myxococcales bacterium]